MSFRKIKSGISFIALLAVIGSTYSNAEASNSFTNFFKSIFGGNTSTVTQTTSENTKTVKSGKYGVDRSGPYEVISVSDGDTFKVKINGKTETVRVLGIDTPEKYVTRTGYVECYGKEASEIAHNMLTSTSVFLEKDLSQQDRDKYGRLLRHVFMEDGTHYQYEMIKSGYAFAYPYGKSSFYDKTFAEAEKLAKSNNVGVWKYCDGKRMPVKEVVKQTKTKTENIINKK